MWLLSRATALLLLFLSLASALKFDIVAQPKNSNEPRCIRNYVSKDTLVVVTVTASGQKGDGQTLNIHVLPHPPLFSLFLFRTNCGGIYRLKTPSATSTESPKTSLARRGWHSLRTPTRHSMCVLRTRLPRVPTSLAPFLPFVPY
jgi:hypothetical protein